MPRRLLFLNAALVAVAVVCALYVARELLTPTPLPLAATAAPPASPPSPAPPATAAPGAYAVVATRNLFSPTRSDTQLGTREDGPVVAAVKPVLHGIVLREDAPIAYLEDPVVKRVAGYRVGDSIVGGTLQRIAADHVVISRPEGPVDVRLRDPSKPRLEAAPAGGTQPAPGTPAPGVVLPGLTPAPSLQPAPSAAAPQPLQPGRRPFPLLRRVPPGVQGDAPQQ